MSKQECPQQQESDNDQVQPQQKAELIMISSVTLEELLEVLDDISCEYEVHEGEVEGFLWIDCDLFEAEFIIFPIGPGPFYQNFSLEAIRPAELDPEAMCTQFNKLHSFGYAIPFDLNEFGDDDTSDIVIAIRKQVLIEAGVSEEFLGSTIELWAGMLLHSLGFFEGPSLEAAGNDEDD